MKHNNHEKIPRPNGRPHSNSNIITPIDFIEHAPAIIFTGEVETGKTCLASKLAGLIGKPGVAFVNSNDSHDIDSFRQKGLEVVLVNDVTQPSRELEHSSCILIFDDIVHIARKNFLRRLQGLPYVSRHSHNNLFFIYHKSSFVPKKILEKRGSILAIKPHSNFTVCKLAHFFGPRGLGKSARDLISGLTGHETIIMNQSGQYVKLDDIDDLTRLLPLDALKPSDKRNHKRKITKEQLQECIAQGHSNSTIAFQYDTSSDYVSHLKTFYGISKSQPLRNEKAGENQKVVSTPTTNPIPDILVSSFSKLGSAPSFELSK